MLNNVADLPIYISKLTIYNSSPMPICEKISKDYLDYDVDLNNNYYVLRLIVNRRDVEHDGYCSDPGEDVGEWRYNIIETYLVSERMFEIFRPHISNDGQVNTTFLRNNFSQYLGCQCGSGWCHYVGSLRVMAGKMFRKVPH
jgi:hypothetical protein